MRRWLTYSWLLVILCAMALFASSCSKEVEQDVPEEAVLPPLGGVIEGVPLTVNMTVPVPELPATRSLEDCGELRTLHLAVFGGSYYLKEYVLAEHTRTEDYTYQSTDNEGNLVYPTVPCYNFEVTISMSDSPRTVHLVGNGPDVLPFGFDTSVMPALLCANGEMGYWQMIYLPYGIRAKRDAEGHFLDKYGHVINENEGFYPDRALIAEDWWQEEDRGKTRYVADETTESSFQHIPLIRNWAKIVLDADNSKRERPDDPSANESNFTPVALAAVNTPSRGAIAPYSAETGFITQYQERSFDYLEEEVKYPGNLPAGTSFDGTIPDKEVFEYFRDHPDDLQMRDGVSNANGGAVYMYERPAPSTHIPPSFVIIYGYYTDPEATELQDFSGYYFYKVDLMETRKETSGDNIVWNSRYYPIYRNFKYQIIVKAILAPGHDTPAAAAASAGSADVSADVTTGHLADISDGVGRLHISPWMAKTFTRMHGTDDPVTELSVFFSKTAGGEADLDPTTVTWEVLPPEDGGPEIITHVSIGDPYDPDSDPGPNPDYKRKGWRTISFCTAAPSYTVRSQKLRIIGTHEFGRLYRDVTVTIQPIQPMSVVCNEPRIASVKGTKQSFTIHIPDGLAESMFPLDFTIEPQDMTLSPDNSVVGNNLPVMTGPSISEDPDYAGKPAFQFVKTLTWAEYEGLERYEDDDESVWKSFTCYFVTNRDDSATTVWVQNEYFSAAHVSFTNYYYKYFKNLMFTAPIPQQEGVTLTATFDLVKDPDGYYPDDYPLIRIVPRGLMIPRDAANQLPAGFTDDTNEEGVYYYQHPNAGTHVSISFVTQTSDADISIDMTANEYEAGHLEPRHFNRYYNDKSHPLSALPQYARSWGILDGTNGSNAAFSMVNSGYQVYNGQYADGKLVNFGYYDDPDALNVPVTLYDIAYRPLTSNNNTSAMKVNSVTFPWTPDGPKNASGAQNYHEIELRTRKNNHDDNVYFILSAPGYMEEIFTADRFFGRVHTLDMNTSWLATNFGAYNSTTKTTVESGFTNYSTGDYGYCWMQILPLDDAPAVRTAESGSPKGLILGQDAEGNAVGGTYRITAKTGGYGSYKQQVLLHLNFQMEYAYRPASATPSSGLFYLYPGSTDRYFWQQTATDVTEATLDLVVEPGRVASISQFSFKSYSSTPRQ